MKYSYRSNGFTLIELLVVISIIGLLSSIILASLSVARSNANSAAGKQFESNLYQAYGADAALIWNLDDGSGTSVADSSGNNNNGSFSGAGSNPVWTTGVYNTGLKFVSGASKSVWGPSSSLGVSATQNMTVAFWVQLAGPLNAGGSSQNTLVSFGDGNADGFYVGVTSASQVEFITPQSGGIDLVSGKAIGADRFYFVAITYSSSGATVYIDGQTTGQSTGSYLLGSPMRFCIGPRSGLNCIATGSYVAANAVYDDVRLYNSSLTADAVYKLYASGEEKAVAFAK
jgi:prepilin-type N-terminal cleavage/methylation domain-containing protein